MSITNKVFKSSQIEVHQRLYRHKQNQKKVLKCIKDHRHKEEKENLLSFRVHFFSFSFSSSEVLNDAITSSNLKSFKSIWPHQGDARSVRHNHMSLLNAIVLSSQASWKIRRSPLKTHQLDIHKKVEHYYHPMTPPIKVKPYNTVLRKIAQPIHSLTKKSERKMDHPPMP